MLEVVSDGSAPSISLNDPIISRSISIPDDVKNLLENYDPLEPLEPFDITNEKYSDFVFPLSIDDKGYPLAGYSNTLVTHTLEVGQPVIIRVGLHDLSDLQHLTFATNLDEKNMEIHKSNAFIEYDKDDDLQIVDSNGFFDTVNVFLTEKGIQKIVDFEITFAKPMETSGIIIRSWDVKRISADTLIFNAIQVMDADPMREITIQEEDLISQDEVNTEVFDPLAHSEYDSEESVILSWMGYDIKTPTDSEVLYYLGIIPELDNADEQTIEIPSWIKDKLGKWFYNESITKDEIKTVLVYFYQQGVLTQ